MQQQDQTGKAAAAAPPPGVSCRLEKAAAKDGLGAPPWVEIPFMRTAPAMDGIYDERQWSAAQPLEPFLTPRSGEPAQPATQCRLGVDDGYLYAVLHCESPPPASAAGAGAGAGDALAVQDDRVEFFVRPGDSAPRYFCMFAVSCEGACLAKKKVVTGSGAAAAISEEPLTLPWQAHVGKTADGWRVELAIPWSTLGLQPGGIKGLRLNVCRSSMPVGTRKHRHSSWAYLPQAHFNWPEKFGIGLCVFDRREGRQATPAELQLDTAGLFSVRRTALPFPVQDHFEIVCAGALPVHACLPGLEDFQVDVELVSIGARGNRVARVGLGCFTLAPYSPARLIVEGIAREDAQIELRFRAQEWSCDYALPVMAGTLGEVEEKLRTVPKLAAEFPYRAAACLGLAACMDRLRRQAAQESAPREILLTMREAKMRLAVLRAGERAPDPGDGLLELLRLTADPHAQVTVEYSHRRRKACVAFSCGALPMISVQVQECADAAEALDMLSDILDRAKGSPMLDSGGENTTIAGCPARIHTRIYDVRSHRPMIAPLDPVRQVLLVDIKGCSAMAMDAAYLGCARVDAAVIMEDCPQSLRDKLTAWARDAAVPLVGIADAVKHTHVLVAGGLPPPGGPLEISSLRALYPMSEAVNGTVSAAAVSGNRVYSVWHVHRAVGIKVLGMVISGRAPSSSETDALRADIVAKCAPPDRQSAGFPDGLLPFCGDVHMHSSYSHGIDEATPAGTTLEAMYCFMDFNVISDHDKVSGTQTAQALLRTHRLDHTLMVGEEIGAGGSHLNAYPLKEVILVSTEEAAVEAAQRQGAVIQWNHPDSDITRMMARVGGRFAALEHLPRRHYDDWKKAGTLPAVTGSSDTHDGTAAFFVCGYFERTLLLAASAREDDLIAAIRGKRVLLVTPAGGRFFYGPDALIAAAWNALADGRELKAVKARQLTRALSAADLVGMIRDNDPTLGR